MQKIEINLDVKDVFCVIEGRAHLSDDVSVVCRDMIFPPSEEKLKLFHSVSIVYCLLSQISESIDTDVVTMKSGLNKTLRELYDLLWNSVFDAFGQAYLMIEVDNILRKMKKHYSGMSEEIEILITLETGIGKKQLFSGCESNLCIFTFYPR